MVRYLYYDDVMNVRTYIILCCELNDVQSKNELHAILVLEKTMK